MNQSYKSLMLGLMLVMAGQSLYSAATGNSSTQEEYIQAFFDAANRGDGEAVLRFLDNKMDVNARDRMGDRALARAADGGHLKIVEFLLDHGAYVDAEAYLDSTALMRAAGGGHLKIVEFLLDQGADVNAVDRTGLTALMYAAIANHLEIIKLLLARGAYVDDEDRRARTAVMHAAKCGHVETVKLLLDRGADSMGIDFSGLELQPVAAVFRAHRNSFLVARLPGYYRQILAVYREFQAGRPQGLKELLGISGLNKNMLMNMQQGKSSAQHRPYVARVEALLGPSRESLEEVFKENCIAQLVYYLKTGKFADTREQAERFLGWSQPALAKTVVDEMMPVEDARPQALPSVLVSTFNTPKAPSSDYVPQAALFGDINMPD